MPEWLALTLISITVVLVVGYPVKGLISMFGPSGQRRLPWSERREQRRIDERRRRQSIASNNAYAALREYYQAKSQMRQQLAMEWTNQYYALGGGDGTLGPRTKTALNRGTSESAPDNVIWVDVNGRKVMKRGNAYSIDDQFPAAVTGTRWNAQEQRWETYWQYPNGQEVVRPATDEEVWWSKAGVDPLSRKIGGF